MLKRSILCLSLVGMAASGAAASPTVHSVQWSVSGGTVAIFLDMRIDILDAQGVQRRSFQIDASPTEIALSPNGDRIAYVANSRQLWILDVADGTRLQVFSAAEPIQSCGELRWSPTGRRLTYSISTGGPPLRADVYMVQPDGTGKVRLMTYAP